MRVLENIEHLHRTRGIGQGNPLAITDANENSAERQRDHTSGDRAEDDDSDSEEAAAHIEANDDNIKIEALPETVQTPLLGIGDIEEPTPQLVQEDADTAMSIDPPNVEAVEAADADADMAADLPEFDA